MSDAPNAPKPCACCDELPAMKAEVARLAGERNAAYVDAEECLYQRDRQTARGTRAIRWAWNYRKQARADRALFERAAAAVRFHTDRGDRLRTALATIAEQARTWQDSPDPWEAVAQIETCARTALEGTK